MLIKYAFKYKNSTKISLNTNTYKLYESYEFLKPNTFLN